jgi:hypothetical protein
MSEVPVAGGRPRKRGGAMAGFRRDRIGDPAQPATDECRVPNDGVPEPGVFRNSGRARRTVVRRITGTRDTQHRLLTRASPTGPYRTPSTPSQSVVGWMAVCRYMSFYAVRERCTRRLDLDPAPLSHGSHSALNLCSTAIAGIGMRPLGLDDAPAALVVVAGGVVRNRRGPTVAPGRERAVSCTSSSSPRHASNTSVAASDHLDAELRSRVLPRAIWGSTSQVYLCSPVSLAASGQLASYDDGRVRGNPLESGLMGSPNHGKDLPRPASGSCGCSSPSCPQGSVEPTGWIASGRAIRRACGCGLAGRTAEPGRDRGRPAR